MSQVGQPTTRVTSHLKLATPEDEEAILPLLLRFILESPYKDITLNITKVRKGVRDMVIGSNDNIVILGYHKERLSGFIALKAYELPFSHDRVAAEIAFYVNPDARGSRLGLDLYTAAEFWSRKVGCAYMQMVNLSTNEGVQKFYERKGYKRYEQAWLKEL